MNLLPIYVSTTVNDLKLLGKPDNKNKIINNNKNWFIVSLFIMVLQMLAFVYYL